MNHSLLIPPDTRNYLVQCPLKVDRGSLDVWDLDSVMHSSYEALQLDFLQSAMPPQKTVTGYYGQGRAVHILVSSNILALQALSALNDKIGP